MPTFIDTNRAQRVAHEWPLLADFCLPRGAENDTKLTLDKRLNQLKQNINF
jgi:hypothetical protein